MLNGSHTRRSMFAAVPALAVAPLPTMPSRQAPAMPDAFDDAMIAFKEAWANYAAACEAGDEPRAGLAMDDVSRKGLELLQSPATLPRHALALLELAHEKLFLACQSLPTKHVPVSDELLTNWDLRDRAFVEAAIRALAAMS